MRKDMLLVVLCVIGSALWWWPVIMDPNLELPDWVPLGLVGLSTGLSTILSGGRWLRFLAVSVIGAVAGLCAGFAIWWPSDPIAGSLVPLDVVVGTLATALVSFVACLTVRKIRIPTETIRRVMWIALAVCLAFGPATLAITPSLVARRVVINDRVAEERFLSLKRAVEQTVAERDGLAGICDRKTLKRHYSGPPFSEMDWHFIAGNYVKRDGYVFGIWIYCPEPTDFAIDAWPVREKGYGTSRFCSDASGKVGCTLDVGSSGYACRACAK
jgi:hypothetical protein